MGHAMDFGDCRICEGTGSCLYCDGLGIEEDDAFGSGYCEECGGSGLCPDCGGTGGLEEDE